MAALPPEWTLTGPTTATFTALLAALPDCPGVVTTTTIASPVVLPRTGSEGLGWSVGIAALLAGLGIGLVTAARRRMT